MEWLYCVSERLVPWAEMCGLIEPYYPKAGNGRPPMGLERMLRMYLIANWFDLADEPCEDALYGIAAFRDFCRISITDQCQLQFTIPRCFHLCKYKPKSGSYPDAGKASGGLNGPSVGAILSLT